MDKIQLYNERALWKYPSELLDIIIFEIKSFYATYNSQKPKYIINRFNNEPAFSPLREHIANTSKYSGDDIPDLGWLQDFYNKRKHQKTLTKVFFESLLSTFKYTYDPETDQFEKRTPKQDHEAQGRLERQRIIKQIISYSRVSDDIFKEFIGRYKYFVGGRKEETRYDYIYENNLEIFPNGQIEVINSFNQHTYLGFATIKTDSCLQIISYDFDNNLLDGIGNLLSFKINKYAKKVLLIPGLSSSFDSNGNMIFAQALLCTNLSFDKKSPIIRDYFDTLVNELRLNSPEIKAVEVLVNKFTNKIG